MVSINQAKILIKACEQYLSKYCYIILIFMGFSVIHINSKEKIVHMEKYKTKSHSGEIHSFPKCFLGEDTLCMSF